MSARSVLEPLVDSDMGDGDRKVKVKSESADILQLCHILPMEVINLGETRCNTWSYECQACKEKDSCHDVNAMC